MDTTTWLVAALVLIGLEMLSGGATQFILVVLGVGCIFAAGAAYGGLGIEGQTLTFAVASFIGTLFVRPLFKKTEGGTIQTNVDRYIGNVGKAKTDITDDGGIVEVLDNKWRAESKSKIKAGESVKVLRVDGTKLIVEKAEEK